MVDEREIKTCPKCGKRYILELGFYKYSTGYYDTYCKKCHIENNNNYELKSRDFTFENHLWEETSVNKYECKMCGLKMKRAANRKKIGKFFYLFWVNGEWTLKRPTECKLNKKGKAPQV